jgi:hypothetical protein
VGAGTAMAWSGRGVAAAWGRAGAAGWVVKPWAVKPCHHQAGIDGQLKRFSDISDSAVSEMSDEKKTACAKETKIASNRAIIGPHQPFLEQLAHEWHLSLALPAFLGQISLRVRDTD